MVEYTDVSINRIQLQVVTTDLTIVHRPVTLKLYIEGNGLRAQSRAVMHGIAPLHIYGGEILTLTSADLAPYFRLQNLEGINQNTYAQVLPEGLYSLCFEMYDLMTQERISQRSCDSMYLMLNDPPLLSLPQDRDQLDQTDFTHIVFNWTPRQLNALNVSYTFELKELRDPNLDAAYAFEMAPILYREEGIRSTSLLYDLLKPTLMAGKKYAWRVKATSFNGLAEKSVFKNDGYSEIRSFGIAVNCGAPTMLLAQDNGRHAVKLSWAGAPTHLKYHLQYRKTGIAGAAWFDRYVVNNQTILTDLEPGFTYEFRVGGTCETEVYPGKPNYTYSRVAEFTLKKTDDQEQGFRCGLKADVELVNRELLTDLVVNESFYAGDFTVKILDLETTGTSVYSGVGAIYVPYLGITLAVEFKNIQINTDYQLLYGVVETAYDKNWENVQNTSELNSKESVREVVDFVIKEIITDSQGNPKLLGTEGEENILKKNKDYTLVDKDGKVWTIPSDFDGTTPITEATSEKAASGVPTSDNTKGIGKEGEVSEFSAKGVRIYFENAGEAKYAFDDASGAKSSGKYGALYKQVQGEYLPYKAVVQGEEDRVVARVAFDGTPIALDSLDFKTSAGEALAFKKVAEDSYVVTVKGRFDYAEEQLMAVFKPEGEDQYVVAGAMQLIHLNAITLPLRIVPTSSSVDTNKLEQAIKTQYSRVGVTVDSKVLGLYTGGALNVSEVSQDDKKALSSYTPSEQKFIEEYFSEQDQEAAFYLFVTDQTGGLKGRMPIKNQFGFVSDSDGPVSMALTAVHELGHGAFELQHPFTQYNTAPGEANSTMDIPPAADFNQVDWKQLNLRKFSLKTLVQTKDDGARVDGEYRLEEDGYFMTPSNKIFQLPKGSKVNFYKVTFSPQKVVNGAIYGFTLPNGKSYQVKFGQFESTIQLGSTVFSGYYEKKGTSFGARYIDKKRYKPGVYSVHLILLVNEETTTNEIRYQYHIVKADINISDRRTQTGGNFVHDPIVSELSPYGNAEVLKEITQVLDYKGSVKQIAKIERGINNNTVLTVFFNPETKQYTVEVELKGNAANDKVDAQKEAIRAHIKELAEEKLRELNGLKGNKSERLSLRVFDVEGEDAGEFYVAEMNGREWLETIGDLGSSIWETASLPLGYWNKDEGYDDSNIHVPPILAGVSDGLTEEALGIQQLVKLGYDVATKEEVRQGVWEGLTHITVSSLLDAGGEAIQNKVNQYANYQEKPYITQQAFGKDAVQVVSTAVGLGVITKSGKLADGVGEVGKQIRKEARKKATKEFLKDFDQAFIDKLNRIPNYDKLEAALVESWKKHHGTKFSIQYIHDKNLIDKIDKFEVVLNDNLGNFTADMVLKPDRFNPSGKFIEFKSWKKGSFSLLNGDQYKNQLKVYMQSGDFEQIFDAQKLSKGGVLDPDTYVKEKVLKVLKDNAEEFRDLIPGGVEAIQNMDIKTNFMKNFKAE